MFLSTSDGSDGAYIEPYTLETPVSSPVSVTSSQLPGTPESKHIPNINTILNLVLFCFSDDFNTARF